MSLLSGLYAPDPRVLEEGYYVLLESHVMYLRRHPQTAFVEVTGQQAAKYRGDFHGLLDTMAISKKYHYLITRVNNMTCSTDFDGVRNSFYIPGVDAISDFMATYNSIEA